MSSWLTNSTDLYIYIKYLMFWDSFKLAISPTQKREKERENTNDREKVDVKFILMTRFTNNIHTYIIH